MLNTSERKLLVGQLIDELHEVKKLCKHKSDDKCDCNSKCLNYKCAKCVIVDKLRLDAGLWALIKKVSLQCHICGRMDEFQIPLEMPIEEAAIIYKQHVAQKHPLAKLSDMILEKYL